VFPSWSRRQWLSVAGRLAAGAAASWAAAGTTLGAQVATKDRRLIVHSDGPLDYETPPALLDQYLTPVESFYVRSHMASPAVDADADVLSLEVVGVLLGFRRAPQDEIHPVGLRRGCFRFMTCASCSRRK
jgi:hypothetical protein